MDWNDAGMDKEDREGDAATAAANANASICEADGEPSTKAGRADPRLGVLSLSERGRTNESASETQALDGRDGIVSWGEGSGVSSTTGKKSVAMPDGDEIARAREDDGGSSSRGVGM